MTETPEMTITNTISDPLDELVNEVYKCLECGKCTGSCPMVELFPDDFHPHHLLQDLVNNPERALSGHQLWLCASCYKCNKRCPQALEIPYIVMKMRSIALLQNGMDAVQRAFELIRERIPFPASFLSVCIHPERINLDPGVILDIHKNNLKDPVREQFPESDSRVAVIGSGPAGLMAAYELKKLGYEVTIFESQAVPGGMFSMAIPEYRLPLSIIQDEVKRMEESGIEFQLNTGLGSDLTIEKLFSKGYKAVLLAVGAHRCKALDMKGEDLEGVFDSLGFLSELKIGNRDIKEKKVIVIGGGNTAMDCASAAIRYGAQEASLLYRRTREEMPADINEIREAEKEGVKIRFLEAPVSILGEKSKVRQVECVKMQLDSPDATGRKRPVPVEDSNFELDADIIVIAVGEEPDTGTIADEVATGAGDTILVNPFTMETSMPGVFAAGDDVSGPLTVADAILGAKRAAIGIDTKINLP